jgi:hypothetical protein
LNIRIKGPEWGELWTNVLMSGSLLVNGKRVDHEKRADEISTHLVSSLKRIRLVISMPSFSDRALAGCELLSTFSISSGVELFAAIIAAPWIKVQRS